MVLGTFSVKDCEDFLSSRFNGSQPGCTLKLSGGCQPPSPGQSDLRSRVEAGHQGFKRSPDGSNEQPRLGTAASVDGTLQLFPGCLVGIQPCPGWNKHSLSLSTYPVGGSLLEKRSLLQGPGSLLSKC